MKPGLKSILKEKEEKEEKQKPVTVISGKYS